MAGDDIINAAEIAVNQTLSGQVTGTAAAGDSVTVTLGGNQYIATVQPDLSWSVSVPAADLQALGNGELTISASVTNSANNTGTATHDIVIDANLPGLRVDTVAGDDVINSIEHTQALVVTGSSTGLAAGAALTVVINSVTYGATVLADGTWSVGGSVGRCHKLACGDGQYCRLWHQYRRNHNQHYSSGHGQSRCRGDYHQYTLH